MAYLVPSDITDLALPEAHTGEAPPLRPLRDKLPGRYPVYHSVHWSRGYQSQPVFGEIDFVIANNDGEVLLIEQKNGRLRQDAEGLWKDYGDTAKNPVRQVRRAQEAPQ